MTTAVYLRQSLDRSGDGVAIARQRDDCLALCEERCWTSITEYVDNDTSASSGKRRPAYDRMLADIRAGQISSVVAWDLDRLHRRPVELESFMDLADSQNLALATVAGDVDLSTAQGRLVARLKGAVARHEVEHSAARRRRAERQRAERGEPAWRNAFGYKTDGSHEPDPVTGPLVAQAYATILAGGSIGDITREWNAKGAYAITGKPWAPATVSLFLRKPRNAGLRALRGQIVGKGTWPGLVDEETWRAAMAVLTDDSRKPGRKSVRKHVLSGVIHCGRDGCAGRLAATRMDDEKKTLRYRCTTCHRVAINGYRVEAMLTQLVSGRLAKPDAVHLLKAEVHDQAEAERLRNERNTLLARLDEIADERADGLLTGQQARRATERITSRLNEVDRAQQDQHRLRVFDGLPLGRPEVVDSVNDLSPDRFRAVLDALCTVTILPNTKMGNQFNPERVRVSWR